MADPLIEEPLIEELPPIYEAAALIEAVIESDDPQELNDPRLYHEEGRQRVDEAKATLAAAVARAKIMHWRARMPVRPLAAHERKEIQNRLWQRDQRPEAWDTNGDKCVDRKEFAKAIKDLGFEFPKSTILKLFDYLDDDGRGTLDYQEMRTALQAPIKSFAKGKPVTKAAAKEAAAASNASATDSSSAACFKPAEGASTVDVSALVSSVDEPTPPLPTGWFEAKSAEGKAYFFHAVTKQTVWERPAPPPEWLAWQKQQREWQEQAKRHGQWQQQQQQQQHQQQQQQQHQHQQQPQTPQPPLGTSSSAPVTPPPQTSSAAPQPSPKRRGKPRRAKTARDLRTAAASATSREDSYWNKEYQPSALATDPLKCNPAGIRGWVDPDGIRRPERSLERRKLIPQVDIGYYEPNGRGAGVKEAGLPAISQAFKESLRSTYVEQFDKLEGSEASVENLRKMLAKAAGERLPLFEY
eukprot:jgi/Chrpa1/3138/Chrysochromulina_OHIO_Genome00006166-RA